MFPPGKHAANIIIIRNAIGVVVAYNISIDNIQHVNVNVHLREEEQ